MPGQHYPITTRTFSANDADAALIVDQDSTGPSLSLTHATQPEIRVAEEDQTDPAGRYRWIVNGDALIWQRAATASWASTTELLRLTGSGAVINEGSADLDFRVEGDANANMLVIDAGTDTIGIGGAVAAGKFLSITPTALSGTPGTTGSWVNEVAATFTDNNTAASGTAASTVFNALQQPTLAATNAGVTTTNAATLYIADAPAAGTNQTITNALALWVDAGKIRLDGGLDLQGSAIQNAWEGYQDIMQMGSFASVETGGWTTGHTGTGGWNWFPTTQAVIVSSGATATSVALVYSSIRNLCPGAALNSLDFDKKLHFKSNINMRSGDAQAVAYVQFKKVFSHGDLANTGMGFKISNLTLAGEIHDGSTRSTVGAGTLVAGVVSEVVIEWDGGTTFEIFLDGVSLGTVTTNLPSGEATNMYMVISITNGTTASDRSLDTACMLIHVKD